MLSLYFVLSTKISFRMKYFVITNFLLSWIEIKNIGEEVDKSKFVLWTSMNYKSLYWTWNNHYIFEHWRFVNPFWTCQNILINFLNWFSRMKLQNLNFGDIWIPFNLFGNDKPDNLSWDTNCVLKLQWFYDKR